MKTLTLILFVTVFFSCATKPKIPEASPEATRICAVGDTGTGDAKQRKVAEAMKDAGCEALVIMGDVIYPDGIKSADDPELAKKFFPYYGEFKKIYIVLGNHDYKGTVSAWKDVAAKDPRIIFPSNYYKEKIGDQCLFFFDTNFDAIPGLVSEESIWLSHQMDDCKTSISFGHHPYMKSGGPGKKFYEENILGKFQYALSGHVHLLHDDGIEKGTHLIVAGSGGQLEPGYRPGFAILDLKKNPGENSVKLIEL